MSHISGSPFTFVTGDALEGLKPAFSAAQSLPHDVRIKGWTTVGGIAVIADLRYFMENREVIEAWCDENLEGWVFSGVVFAFKTTKDAILFKMKWC